MCLPFLAPIGYALGATSAAAAASTGTIATMSVGLGAATAGVSMAAQSEAASQQNAYRARLGIAQNRAYEQNVEAVTRDIGLQIDQLASRDIEQAAATRLELENISRNAKEAGATMRARTGAVGVEGQTIALLHNQFDREIAEFESVAARNMKTFRARTEMEARAIYARGQSAINNGYPNPLPPPATVSPLTSILGGITTGLSTFGTLNSAFGAPPGVGGDVSGVANNASAPWYLQANPGPGTFGTPPLLAAPAPTMPAPFFLSR